jgi:raffinose/stachyose/melibiose transport system permease protein
MSKITVKILLQKYFVKMILYLVLISAVILVLTPIIINAMGGLKTRGEYMSQPYSIPIPPRWENYERILNMSSFWLMLANSFIVMTATTLGVVLFCSMAAFTLARMNFRAKNLIFNVYTLGLMFPINIAILPVYCVAPH